MADTPARADELYVGYLPVPPGQRHFLRWTIPLLLWIVCAATFVWARSQHTPGRGVWDQGQPVQIRGLLAAYPYPTLFVADSHGQVLPVLLVEVGKHGSARRLSKLDGHLIVASGWPLHRDGYRMLELEPSDSAITDDHSPPADSAATTPTVRLMGTVSLRGEIVDSKCFLGAMKPGDGKTHKACATLCIRGGIPPLFVARDSNNAPTFYLVQNHEGGPIDPAVLPFVGDLIQVQAEHVTWGELRILRLRPENITRP